ncbi:MAG: glycosyltransferase family 4 protein [candidate division Zixibacteria bacterium]|nr:glycosyltransferase family 4 protein [candidate division Zixibacteria bacterium]
MKIAFIGQKGIPAIYGGIEDFTEKVSLRLVKRGHQVTVYCRPYYTRLNGDYKGVALKKIRSIKSKHLDAISHTFLSSLDALFEDYDVINYQGTGPSSLSFLPRLKGKTKIVATIHSLDWKRKKWGVIAKTLLRMAEYPSVYYPHKVVTISEGLKKYLEKKYNKEIFKLTPGIDPPNYRAPKRIKKFGLEKEKFILFLGRLVPEKGCHYLLKAYRDLNTDYKLFIAGNGFFSEDYLNKLHQYKSDRILFGGFVEKEVLEELFSNAYLYVLPSEVEGVPQTLLQALSYGRCVLASDIPENKEAMGKWGFNFRNKDIKDLNQRLNFLLNNRELVLKGQNQRSDYVKAKYSWDRTAEDLEKLFIQCVGSN